MILQYLLLAFVQGITEFLPVSSSGHLILTSEILGFVDQGLTVDVALHFGSLLAILIYLFEEHFRGRAKAQQLVLSKKIISLMIVGVLPTVVVAPFIADYVETSFRSATSIGVVLIFFAIVLFLASRRKGTRSLQDITHCDALIIGICQLFAFIPGTSRSGVTISAGLSLGIKPIAAIQFSFLIAIPTLLGATAYQFIRAVRNDEIFNWPLISIGIVASTIISYISLRLLIGVVQQFGFTPFVLYRIGLGVMLFIFY